MVSSQHLWIISWLSASTVNFEMIFDAFVWPVKFVASVRNSLSSQNESCIEDLSKLIEKKELYWQETLDHYWRNKLTICWPSTTRNESKSLFLDPRWIMTEQTHNFVNAEFWGTLRWPPESIWSTGNFIWSLRRSAAIPWMMRCVSTKATIHGNATKSSHKFYGKHSHMLRFSPFHGLTVKTLP